MNRDAITWFEIPAQNLDRAQSFYEQLLGATLRRESMGGPPMAVFPAEEGGATGCLMAMEDAPSGHGTLVYLDAGPTLDATLARATALGARIATPRTALPPGLGFFAHIVDCEGNRVGLHALA